MLSLNDLLFVCSFGFFTGAGLTAVFSFIGFSVYQCFKIIDRSV